MVAEPIKLIRARGVEVTQVENPPNTGNVSVSFVPIETRSGDDYALEKLSFESFASDWESDADSIYDSLLKDASLQ